MANDEGSEQPVREQLKKASIQNNAVDAAGEVEIQPEKKTISKKRSYEDITDGDPSASTDGQHTRKRSRDNTAELEQTSTKRVSSEASRNDLANGNAETTSKRPATPPKSTNDAAEPKGEIVASPKTKRSRLQDIESSTITTDEHKSELPPGSAFANSSSTSAFGSLANASADKQTSKSAFASSTFGALAGAKTSGFGAVGSSGGLTSFASPKKEPSTGTDNAPSTTTNTSGFASLGGKSGFATSTSSSGFGSGLKSNGFASASGFGALGGTGLSSFASGKTGSGFGSQKPAKPFGAPANEEEEEDGEEDDGIKSPRSIEADEDKKDERFYKQDIETGEEREDTLFQGRAKLYNYTTNTAGKKEWKERGTGVVKLNVTKLDSGKEDDASETEGSKRSTARFLMRVDGSHRVVLNTPIMKDMKYGDINGGPPDTGHMLFMGTIDGNSTLELLQLRMRPNVALELYEKIVEVKSET